MERNEINTKVDAQQFYGLVVETEAVVLDVAKLKGSKAIVVRFGCVPKDKENTVVVGKQICFPDGQTFFYI